MRVKLLVEEFREVYEKRDEEMLDEEIKHLKMKSSK